MLRLFFLLILAAATVVANEVQPEEPTPNTIDTGANNKDDDWARKYLDRHPLAAIEQPTLDDLKQALNDPAQQDTVIKEHFARVSLNAEQQQAFLREALAHPSPTVNRQAAVELKRLGMLSEVTQEILLEMSQRDDDETQSAAVIALQHLVFSVETLPDHYSEILIRRLADETPAVRVAAGRQLEALGAAAVPVLLKALDSDDTRLRLEAAQVLSRIIGTQPPTESRAVSKLDPESATVAKSTPRGYPGPRMVREFESNSPTSVRVYFGTNRSIVSQTPDPRMWLFCLPLLLLACVVGAYMRLRRPSQEQRRGKILSPIPLICLGVGVWSVFAFNSSLSRYLSQHIGTEFGPRRDQDGNIHYGWCDVSIPATHEVGEVEQPMLGPENESQHVILKRTELLESKAFVDQVRRILSERPESARDCFVFVHGYNVTFAKAARRTAQIHHDLDFQGVPLFYSWPSRGSIRHYVSDKNEIGYSAEHIGRFLVMTAERFDANRVHVIAHSMGAEGVGRAIASMGEQRKRFDQIVLAAPDIDADTFRTQLAPKIVSQFRRATLYCSRNDWALHASYAFNDSPRIGDSSRAVVVLKHVDTVDASEMDTDLLGHSYYGDCLPLLRDVDLLLTRGLAPDERGLNANIVLEGLPYWTFQ